MGFTPSKAEPDIWLHCSDDRYEYIAVYVDDLAIAAKDPRQIVRILMETYKFKLKGTGHISFHLGMDFFRDEHGVICMAPKQYIEKMWGNFECMFGHPHRQVVTSPIEKNEHPELDTMDLLADDDIVKYQSLIGALQWVVSIGWFDVMTAIMTLSSFQAAPQQGHMECIKHIYGTLLR